MNDGSLLKVMSVKLALYDEGSVWNTRKFVIVAPFPSPECPINVPIFWTRVYLSI